MAETKLLDQVCETMEDLLDALKEADMAEYLSELPRDDPLRQRFMSAATKLACGQQSLINRVKAELLRKERVIESPKGDKEV